MDYNEVLPQFFLIVFCNVLNTTKLPTLLELPSTRNELHEKFKIKLVYADYTRIKISAMM
jgi:hypothetical protein